MKNRFDFTFRCLLALAFFAVIFTGSLFAGSAQWNLNPSSDWNTAGNWTPATVPNGPSDTAIFGPTNNATVSLSANTEVNGINFNATASAYTITANPTFTLTISGVGITNNSGIAQNFVTAVDGSGNLGTIVFHNSATAGSMTVFTNNGATLIYAYGGITNFEDTSTAGSATINNNGGTFGDANGGATDFNNTSTAGSATINNNGASTNANSGETDFDNTSTAGSAIINNNGGTANSASGGFTFFLDTSTAGSATINNNAGTVSGASGGETDFESTSSAGSAHINIAGAGATGQGVAGRVVFSGNATAGNATFFNGSSSVVNAEGGQIFFYNQTNAGTASIENFNGVGNGITHFFASASAGGSFIVNDGGTAFPESGGETDFNDTSTAAGAEITNNGSTAASVNAGETEFKGSSTAGSASITNLSGGNGGETDFLGSSTAGTATIDNIGGSAGNLFGGSTHFLNTANAGSATITNSGGSGAGAIGGYTPFTDNSDASGATLIANGGTTGGGGGSIFFDDDSTGGTARVEVFGNGQMDISEHNAPGVTVGSIEGSGNVFLGANNLTVGSNNLSTTFSGVVQDGGSGGGTGGSLTKIGTGTLTLSNDNTFTGALDIENGTVAVDSLFALGAGNVRVNGGLLRSVTGNETFVVQGNYVQNSGGTLRIGIGRYGGLISSDTLEANGTASLSGTLQLVNVNNFTPTNGERVTIITDNGGHTGVFDTVTNNFAGVMQPVVRYDEALDIYVQFQLGSFNIGGLTPNQKSVAHNLDVAANDPAAAPLINFLVLEPLGALPHDYDLIAPEELASIYEIGFSQAVVQNDNLQRRMDDIRAGSNGFCADGFVPQVSGKDYTKDSDGKASLPDKSTRDVYTPAPDNRWGVFVTGTGDFVNVGNDDSNAPGYDITTGDVTVGADYRLCNNFAIGIDAGYSRSTADLVDDGRVDVDGGKVGAYATMFGKGLFGSKFYVDGAVGGGFNSYDTRRTGLQDEPVRGSTDGSEFNAMISYGSDWTFGCFNIGTWSSVQFTNVSIDQFTETGSLAPLIIQDQDENSFRATTGLHASYDIKAGHFIFRPEVRVAYQHEYCDQAYQVDSQLASGAGGVFRVRGPDIGRDSALVGTGMSMQWNNRLSTYVYYDGVLGRNNYDNNAVSGGFRIGF